jgi:hypothetical protein
MKGWQAVLVSVVATLAVTASVKRFIPAIGRFL